MTTSRVCAIVATLGGVFVAVAVPFADGTRFSDFTPLTASAGPTADESQPITLGNDRLIGYRWRQPAYSLSYANRRRLEIARATAAKPRLLLLDEPAAGMNPVETHEMTELIAQLREEGGYTILVIEHDMHVVEGISDRVVALDHGVKIAEGSFDEVATDPGVIEAYLGTRRRSACERERNARAAAPARGHQHLLRADAHPPGRRTSRSGRASSSACSAGTRPASRRR